MTNTSRRLRALAGRLCEYADADYLTEELLFQARHESMHPVEYLMKHANWMRELKP